MPTRTLSFRYDAIHDRLWHERCFREMATKRGLRLTTNRTQTRTVFKPNDVEAAVGELWNQAEVRNLQKAGALPLSSERMDRLCRPVTIHTLVFQDESGSLKVTVEAAERNEYPCIGGDVWLAKELMLPGGFIDIESSDKREIDAISNEFVSIRYDGRPPAAARCKCPGK